MRVERLLGRIQPEIPCTTRTGQVCCHPDLVQEEWGQPSRHPGLLLHPPLLPASPSGQGARGTAASTCRRPASPARPSTDTTGRSLGHTSCDRARVLPQSLRNPPVTSAPPPSAPGAASAASAGKRTARFLHRQCGRAQSLALSAGSVPSA